jgi:DNA polymerase III alpha subunit
MCAQTSSEIGNFDKMPGFVAESMAIGFKMLPPNVNKSIEKFVPEEIDGKVAIRYGLGGIKGVGMQAATAIVEEREKNGPYKSFNDFISRTICSGALNSRALEALIRTGGVDSLGIHRAAALADLPNAISRANANKRDIESGQGCLFGSWDDAPTTETNIPDIPEMRPLEILLAERELLGVFLSGHPLSLNKKLTSSYKSIDELNTALERLQDGASTSINICLFILAVDKKPSKENLPVVKPEIESAEIAAQGPGIAKTGIFSSAQSLTKSSPGSDIAGVPASLTIAQDSPFFILAIISSPFSCLLCS